MMTQNLQAPAINTPIIREDQLEGFDVVSLEQERSSNGLGYNYDCGFPNTTTNYEEEQDNVSHGHLIGIPSLYNENEVETMPFLQTMPPFAEQQPQIQCSFQMLLSLQHQLRMPTYPVSAKTLESESCLAHQVAPTSTITHSGVSSSPQKTIARGHGPKRIKSEQEQRDRRKRKQTTSRPPRDKGEVESQRMAHITVERNRRRLMNDHLACLRSLMPPSYAQRGDQASIIGGAIDFVKELEQLLQTLQAHKRMRKPMAMEEELVKEISTSDHNININSNSNSNSSRSSSSSSSGSEDDEQRVEVKVATMIDKHVNLKIECCGKKREGQLVRAIVGLEEHLRLTVLHLNIISSQSSSTMHYSFSLKMEEDCELERADEIAGAVAKIFRLVNARS